MKKDHTAGFPAAARAGVLLAMTICVLALGAAFAAHAPAHGRYDLVYFDGHMHTVESDGSGTVDDVKTAALHNGVDAVIVTNHTKMLTLDEWRSLNRRARELSGNGFLIINAFEVTGSEGLFLRDHVLAWDVADPFVGRDSDELAPEEVWESPANPAGTGALHPENIRKWVRYIHRQGGIAVHAHTDGSTDPSYGVDYIEVFNLSHVKDVANYATMMGFPADQAWGLGLTLNNMAIYGERDLSMQVMLPGVPTPLPLRDALYAATKQMTGVGQVLGGPEAPLHSWDELLMGYVDGELAHPTFGVADSDAHNTANLAAAGDYSDVGESRNGVLVRRLTRDGLFDAIKAGRCFATTGPSLEFTVDGKQMGETAKMRTRRSARAELELSADAASPGAVLAKVTIVKNGEVLRTLSPMTPSLDTSIRDCVDEDGYYRVEIVSVDTATGQYQFAYSNPVFVEMAGSRCGH
jgi:hypothetical protein